MNTPSSHMLETSPDKKRLLKFKVISMLISTALILTLVTRLFALNSFEGIARIFYLQEVLRSLALTGIFTLILSSFYFFLRNEMSDNKKLLSNLIIVLTSIGVTYLISLLTALNVNEFAMPLSLIALLIGALVDRKLGVTVCIICSLLIFIGYISVIDSTKALSLAGAIVANMIAGILMVLTMEPTHSRMKYLAKSLVVACFMAPIAILTSVLSEDVILDAINDGLWGLLSATIAVTIFMLILPFFERVFKVYTNFRLCEICSFDNKLLLRLSKEAPGTFNHSLIVGNLAEICALAINENTQLAKAAGYYHDIGKIKNPECFIENQKGYNPHDDFIPEVSVSMITNHTSYGYELIKNANLPDILADISIEHHGTTPVTYFYYKAQNITEENLEREKFSYDGPRPTTKIAAIIMIADTVEAATRATGINTDREEFKKYVSKLVNEKAKQDQFINCPLTFKDVELIIDTLVDVLPSMYHQRIDYARK